MRHDTGRMKKSILVGTHHKTGTKWLADIFRSFCRRRGIPFHDISIYRGQFRSDGEQAVFVRRENENGACVFFDANSRFQGITAEDNGDFVGVHVIRDPRDVIISATHYHQFAKEDWLHVARDDLGGMSYQEKLNSLSTLQEKLEFEMRFASRWVIHWMGAFKSRDLFKTFRYETLIGDGGLVEWGGMAGYLGLDQRETKAFLNSVQRNSLFGKKRKTGSGTHIRSGKVSQHRDPRYRDAFREFEALFPGVLRNLGYDQ